MFDTMLEAVCSAQRSSGPLFYRPPKNLGSRGTRDKLAGVSRAQYTREPVAPGRRPRSRRQRARGPDNWGGGAVWVEKKRWSLDDTHFQARGVQFWRRKRRRLDDTHFRARGVQFWRKKKRRRLDDTHFRPRGVQFWRKKQLEAGRHALPSSGGAVLAGTKTPDAGRQAL